MVTVGPGPVEVREGFPPVLPYMGSMRTVHASAPTP